MSTFLIVLAVILWVGYKAYKSISKTLADSEGGSEAPSQGTVRSAFESLFEEESNHSFSSTVKPGASFSDEERASGYFTYEDVTQSSATQQSQPQPRTRSAKQAAKTTKQAPASAAMADNGERSSFDLRQAVIYQTILNNQYLDEIHSYDN